MSEVPNPAAFEEAKALFFAGLASLEAGRFEQAERDFLAALVLVPGRVSTLVNLAATRLALSKPEAALANADEVLAVEPDNRDACFHRATALATLARLDEARAGFERVLTIDATLGEAWSRYGGVLRESGRLDDAARAFAKALEHGADRELNTYYLAAVSGTAMPASAPRRYVRGLFHDYAEGFDEHLALLDYQAHVVLTRHLAAHAQGPFESALDLGCGTGLCGPLVRPSVRRLAGVDLSGAMLDKARALGVYDELVQADLTQHLQTTELRHDLLLAADVFIYVGELAPVFGAVRVATRPGALFCFSVELCSDAAREVQLLPSLRYAHSEAYVRRLAAEHGFEVAGLLRQPVRHEQRRPIAGLYACLRRA